MMSDTKVLQALLDGQSSIKEELKQLGDRLEKRLDKLGLQIANLEDDSPTYDEFNSVEQRIKNLENRFLTS